MKNFKSPNGKWLTKRLFIENDYTADHLAVYSLKDENFEYKGTLYPSLCQLYLHERDLTEYSFAVKHLGGWEHWETLVECDWFQPYLMRWREELERSIKAEALRAVEEISKDRNHSGRLTAAKFLLQDGWRQKADRKASGPGRPSKASIQAEAKKLAEQHKDLQDDLRVLEGSIE